MGIAGKALRGSVWINLSKYYQTAIKFFGGVYLARQIDPYFFGQYGLSIAIISLILSLNAWGQQYAIIGYRGDIKKFISIHITLRIMMVSVIGISLIILYALSTYLWNSELIMYLLCLFASQAPWEVMGVYIFYMERELMFFRITVIDAISTTCGLIVACILACFNFKIWALLCLFMTDQLMRAFLTFSLSPLRVWPGWDKHEVIDFLSYGKYVFSVNLMRLFQDKVGHVSIGSIVGNTALGLYQRAVNLGGLLQQIVTGGVQTVTTPVFGKVKDDRKRFGQNFELVASLLFRIAVGGYLWMGLVIPALILLLYGDKWLPAAPLFQLLIPFAFVQSFNEVVRDAHLVTGESAQVSRIKGIELGVLLLFLFPLLFWKQAAGAAIAVDISAVLGCGLYLHYLKGLAEFSIRRIVVNPLIAGGISAITVMFSTFSLSNLDQLHQLALKSFLFWIIFIIVLLFCEYGFWKQTYLRIKIAVIS